MRKPRRSALIGFALIDVMVALVTNLIADGFDHESTWLILGTTTVLGGVMLVRLVLQQDYEWQMPDEAQDWAMPATDFAAERSAEPVVTLTPERPRSRQALMSVVTVIAVLGLLTMTALTGRREHREEVRAQVTPSVSPAGQTLREYLLRWANGPVRISVDHYNAWVQRPAAATSPARGGAPGSTYVDLRVSIRNEGDGHIDLSAAPESLVLIVNSRFPDSADHDEVRDVPEIPATYHAYALGFDNADGHPDVIYKGTTYKIHWTGTGLDVGDEFAEDSPRKNGIGYEIPAPSERRATENNAVPLTAAHVLGVAWLDGSGRVRGYREVKDWAGPNSFDSFLKA
jgi:hypothetical protein